MMTPEYSKRYNCRVCGWRHCPGCDDPPEPEDDPYEGDPEALGWQRATTEELVPVPKHDAPPLGDASL